MPSHTTYGAEGIAPAWGETAEAPGRLLTFTVVGSRSLRSALGSAVWSDVPDGGLALFVATLIAGNWTWAFGGQHDLFMALSVFGEKAVAAAQAVRLPTALVDANMSAPRYAEGRCVRITVTSSRQVPGLVTRAQIKRRN